MALNIRRPFAITGALKQLSKPTTPLTGLRSLHTTPPKQTFRQPAASVFFSITSRGGARRSIFQNAFRSTKENLARGARTYIEPASQSGYGSRANNSGELRKRLLYGAGMFGATVIALNVVFNSEGRTDGGMPPHERAYLNDTMLHTGLGLGIIAIAARTLHSSGFAYRIMAANPWVVFGVGLVGSIGTMYATLSIPPENYIPKYALWTGFNLTQAALLCPLMFLEPALLVRAGLYTVGMMGSLAFVGATAKQDKYLYIGGPLLAGVAVVALSGLAPLVLPATATRTLFLTENLWLYGGLVVFGGFTLYDVQKVLHHARLTEAGVMKKDVVNESIRFELDFINIFVRLVQILGMQNRRK